MPLANISTGSTGIVPVAVPQIDISDVLQVNKEMNEALLKNVELHQALADQTGLSDKERNAKASDSDLRVKENNAQAGLLPQQVQAKQALLQRDIDITPAQTQVDLGDIQAKKTLQPGALASALQGQNTALPQQQFAENEAIQDPSGSLTHSRTMYETMFGSAAKKDDGSIDYDSMQSMNHQVAAARLRAIMNQSNSPLSKEMFDELSKRNSFSKAFNADGTLKSQKEIADVLTNTPIPLSPTEAKKAASDYTVLNAGVQKLEELKGVINDPAHDVVGPRIGQGDIVGTSMARMRAWVGGDQTKLARQQQIHQAIAQQLGDMMKSFSGIRNQKEFNTLGGRIPDLTNPKESWSKYLDDAIGLTKQTMESIKSELPAGVSIPDSVAAPTPAVTAPASNLPVVNSQQAYDALPSGAQFQDGTGAVGRKP